MHSSVPSADERTIADLLICVVYRFEMFRVCRLHNVAPPAYSCKDPKGEFKDKLWIKRMLC